MKVFALILLSSVSFYGTAEDLKQVYEKQQLERANAPKPVYNAPDYVGENDRLSFRFDGVFKKTANLVPEKLSKLQMKIEFCKVSANEMNSDRITSTTCEVIGQSQSVTVPLWGSTSVSPLNFELSGSQLIEIAKRLASNSKRFALRMSIYDNTNDILVHFGDEVYTFDLAKLASSNGVVFEENIDHVIHGKFGSIGAKTETTVYFQYQK